MAKRPSTKEILELARKGGLAKPIEAASSYSRGGSGNRDGGGGRGRRERVGFCLGRAALAARPVAPVNVRTPSSLGRPLTLKEKLATARAGRGSTGRKRVGAGSSGAGDRQAARAAHDAPEKLAARRGGGAQPARGSAAPRSRPRQGPRRRGEDAAARVLPPLEKMSDPRDLAEAARQAAAKKAKEIAAEAAAKAPPKPRSQGPGQAADRSPPADPRARRAPRPRPRAAAQPPRFLRRQTCSSSWIIAGLDHLHRGARPP